MMVIYFYGPQSRWKFISYINGRGFDTADRDCECSDNQVDLVHVTLIFHWEMDTSPLSVVFQPTHGFLLLLAPSLSHGQFIIIIILFSYTLTQYNRTEIKHCEKCENWIIRSIGQL